MSLSKEKYDRLKSISKEAGKSALQLCAKGGAFGGAALSCTDMITYLYKEFLDIGDHNFEKLERDYFLLSKGHAVPALYGVFVELGWLERDRLDNHATTKDDIYLHPNVNIKGVEFHSGSLGHSLSIGIGVAMDMKLRKSNNKVVVMLGDGEINEGSIWEGIFVASAHKLDNLIIIVDRNKFQANFRTEELIPVEPLEDKFKAFGFITHRIDGHDFNQIHDTFSNLDLNSQQPNIVIADTIRGKGVDSIKERSDKWFVNYNEEELELALKEYEIGYK